MDDELVLKITASVDDAEVKKLREQLKTIQDDFRKKSIDLGIDAKVSPTTKLPQAQKDVKDTLGRSQRILEDIAKSVKPSAGKKEPQEDKIGLPPQAEGMSNMAKVGIAAGATVSILSLVKDLFDKATKMVDARIAEDVKLDTLATQTGKTKKELFLLGEQAKLTNTSLDAIVNQQKNFSKEMMTGLSPEKAQYAVALGINLEQLFNASNGDIDSFLKKLYTKINERTKSLPAFARSNIMESFGFTPELQRANKYINRSDTRSSAASIFDKATKGGEIPLRSAEQTQQERLSFGTQEGMKAAMERQIASTDVAIQSALKYIEFKTDLVEITAATVNIVDKGVKKVGDFIKNNEKNIAPFSNMLNSFFGKDNLNSDAAKVTGGK
jgi:hypothetical protein